MKTAHCRPILPIKVIERLVWGSVINAMAPYNNHQGFRSLRTISSTSPYTMKYILEYLTLGAHSQKFRSAYLGATDILTMLLLSTFTSGGRKNICGRLGAGGHALSRQAGTPLAFDLPAAALQGMFGKRCQANYRSTVYNTQSVWEIVYVGSIRSCCTFPKAYFGAECLTINDRYTIIRGFALEH
jgi:hypothetical protein